MADEQIEEEEGGGKRGGLVKIIMLVVGVVLVVLLTIGLTLYFTGFFDPGAEEVAEEQISALETEAVTAAEEVAQQPAKIQLEAPAVEKFETVYYELEREFLANVANSRKVMQIKLAIMTHYDEQVISNIEKHTFAIRSSILDIMRQVTEQDVAQEDFRTDMAEDIRLAMNATLEEFEDFGGIEKVYFSEFIVQ
ncbi:MAG TPA: flagellar protein [Gammaproteobacteria bacterium]|nr:flagellar protein [Gammaproteobacteria bacterium]|tara:strand:- start:218 stop:799 length:582 start_codon:yes stop_codon:yes gene_type:complete